MFTKWKSTFWKRFSCLQNGKARFWSVFMFIKWKNSFLKRFSSLQNEKTCFEEFYLQNVKNMFLKRVTSVQNENPRFLKRFSYIFTKWEKDVSKRFSSLQIKKATFWSVLMYIKWKNSFLKRFSCFETFLMFTKWKTWIEFCKREYSSKTWFLFYK